ncbi:MAG: hypothetical protein AAGB19_08930 [Cyanobacteria bacterium P01_F01_bin.3]
MADSKIGPAVHWMLTQIVRAKRVCARRRLLDGIYASESFCIGESTERGT